MLLGAVAFSRCVPHETLPRRTREFEITVRDAKEAGREGEEREEDGVARRLEVCREWQMAQECERDARTCIVVCHFHVTALNGILIYAQGSLPLLFWLAKSTTGWLQTLSSMTALFQTTTPLARNGSIVSIRRASRPRL